MISHLRRNSSKFVNHGRVNARHWTSSFYHLEKRVVFQHEKYRIGLVIYFWVLKYLWITSIIHSPLLEFQVRRMRERESDNCEWIIISSLLSSQELNYICSLRLLTIASNWSMWSVILTITTTEHLTPNRLTSTKSILLTFPQLRKTKATKNK